MDGDGMSIDESRPCANRLTRTEYRPAFEQVICHLVMLHHESNSNSARKSNDNDGGRHPVSWSTNSLTRTQAVCQFYLRGACKFGNECRNEHPQNAQTDRRFASKSLEAFALSAFLSC